MSTWKTSILCVAPPCIGMPFGLACLMGQLKQSGCNDFSLLDLTLWTSSSPTPTYCSTSAFCDTYVLDVPDLPLVLLLLDSVEKGKPFLPDKGGHLRRYCIQRAIDFNSMHRYLCKLDSYLATCFEQIPDIDFIGFSVWTHNFLATMMAAARLKKRKRPPYIVIGGPCTTQSRNATHLALQSRLVDAAVIGEGEVTFCELYRRFRHASRTVSETVPGMLVWTPDNRLSHSERPLMKLEERALPDFSSLPLVTYQMIPGIRMLPMESSRGCTSRCNFCSEWGLWKRYRAMKPDLVADQMVRLSQEYNANCFVFTDALLNGSPHRLNDFLDILIKNNSDIYWCGMVRASVDKDSARRFQRAGCRSVFVGVESLSSKTLKSMNKRRSKADNIRSVRNLLDVGISVTAGLIAGFPGDFREGVIETAGLLSEIQRQYPHRFTISIEPYVIRASQPVFERLEEFGLAKHAWAEEVLDIAPSYRNITANIAKSISGSNQGAERFGEWHIYNAILHPHKSSESMLGLREEDVNDCSMRFLPIRGQDEYGLGSYKSSKGVIVDILLSRAEKKEWQELARNHSGKEPFLQSATASVFIRKITAKHLVQPGFDGPRILSVGYPVDCDSGLLCFSPVIVARQAVDNSRKFLFVDPRNRKTATCRAEFGKLLVALSKRPHSRDMILTHAGNIEPLSKREVENFLDEFIETGMIVQT